MRRREALAALGLSVGMSGCQAIGASSPSSYNGPDDAQRKITITEQDTVAPVHELSIQAEMVQNYVTPARTAQFRLTVANYNGNRHISIHPRASGCTLFSGESSTSEPPGIWLRGPETADDDRPDNRWAAKTPLWTGQCGRHHYKPDESVVNHYLIWDDLRVDGYLTSDTYRFENTVTKNVDVAEFPWGFTIRVEDVSGGLFS